MATVDPAAPTHDLATDLIAARSGWVPTARGIKVHPAWAPPPWAVGTGQDDTSDEPRDASPISEQPRDRWYAEDNPPAVWSASASATGDQPPVSDAPVAQPSRRHPAPRAATPATTPRSTPVGSALTPSRPLPQTRDYASVSASAPGSWAPITPSRAAAPQDDQFSPFDDVFNKYAGDLAGNPEFLSIVAAGTRAESGHNPRAVGDGGHSAGLFQINDLAHPGGDWRYDPDQASAYMVPQYAAAYRRIKAANPGLSGPQLAAAVAQAAERSADPTGVRYAQAYQQLVPNQSRAELRPSQFGDRQLSTAEAQAACGPAAAVAFARAYGRNPTLREATDLAKKMGWTPGAGMRGPQSEVALMKQLGIDAHLGPAKEHDVAARVGTGKPVSISTGLHYFVADDYDPSTGKFYVGTSGTDLKGGSEWMTLDQMDTISRNHGYEGIQSAIFADAPIGGLPEYPQAGAPQVAAPAPSGAMQIRTPKAWFTYADSGREILRVEDDQAQSQFFDVGQTDAEDGAVLDTGTLASGEAVGAGQDVLDPGTGDDSVRAPAETPEQTRLRALDADLAPPPAEVPAVATAEGGLINTAPHYTPPPPPTQPIVAVPGESPESRQHFGAALAGGLRSAPRAEQETIAAQESTPRAPNDPSGIRQWFQYVDTDGREVIRVDRHDGSTQFYPLDGTSDQPPGTVTDAGNLVGPPPDGWQKALPADAQAQTEPSVTDFSGFTLTPGQRSQVAQGIVPAQATTNQQPAIGGPVGDALRTGADVVGGMLPDLSSQLPSLAPDSPISRQAAGQTTNPREVSQQIGQDLAQTVVPESLNASVQTPLGTVSVRDVVAQVLQPESALGLAAGPVTAGMGPIDLAVNEAISRLAGPGARAAARLASPAAEALGRIAAAPASAAGKALAQAVPGAVRTMGDVAGGTLQRGVERAGEIVGALPGGQSAGAAIYARAPAAASARFAATLGGAAAGASEAAVQTPEDDPNRIHKIVAGAAAGGAGMFAVTHWTPEVLKGARDLLAPAENLPDAARTAVTKLATGLNGAREAGQLWDNRIRAVLGEPGKGANVRDAASLYEAGHHFSATPTPEMRQLAADMEWFANQTGDEGRRLKYIGGDVRNRAFPGQRYFPHVYQDSFATATSRARPKRLNPRDFYSNERTHSTLQDAIRAGREPLDSVSEPFAHYAERVQASKARAQFIQDLKGLKHVGVDVMRSGNAAARRRMPAGWVWGGDILPHDTRFTQYWFEPSVARVLENLTQPSVFQSNPLLRGVTGTLNEAKRVLLGMGTFHLTAESYQTMAANGPVHGSKVLSQSLWNAFTPGAWRKFQVDNFGLVQQAADAGVTLNFGGHAADVGGALASGVRERLVRGGVSAAAGAGFGYGQAKQQGAGDEDAIKRALTWSLGTGIAGGTVGVELEKAIFERALPTMKVLTWALHRNNPAAASFVNRTFGGNNLEVIGRSPTVQAAIRGIVLAPDWWEGWVRQVGNAFLPGASGDLSRRYWAQAVTTGTFALEGLNLALNGHPTTDNEPGHQLDLEVSRLYDMMGWSRRDPKSGQPMRVYWDVLGPFRSLAELAIAGGKAISGRAGQGVLPGVSDQPGTTALQFGRSRLSPAVGLASEALSGKDFFGQAVVSPGTDPLHALAVQVSHELGNLLPVPLQQYQQEGARGGPLALATSAVGHRLSFTTPTSQALKDRDRQIQALGGDVQKVQQATQQRTKLRDQTGAQIANLYSNPGSRTHSQIDQEEMKLRDQVPALPEMYSSLSGAPISPELADFLSRSVAGAAGSDAPSDLNSDAKGQLDQFTASYWNPQPAEQMAKLDPQTQQGLRRQKLQEMAQQLNVDPNALLDAIKAKAWNVPLPDLGPNVTSADVESWLTEYLQAGKDAQSPHERAAERQQAIQRIARDHPGVSPDAVQARINLRLTPTGGNVPEAEQSHQKALDLLLQSEAAPKYVDASGRPMGGPPQWAMYDAQIKAGSRKQGIRTIYDAQAKQLKDARDRATAARNRALLNSANSRDYQRWFGEGRNMTEAEWQAYQANPGPRWKDNPPADEARFRERVLLDYAGFTPEQRYTIKTKQPIIVNGKPQVLTVEQAYRHFLALQKPDWQQRLQAAQVDLGLTDDGGAQP